MCSYEKAKNKPKTEYYLLSAVNNFLEFIILIYYVLQYYKHYIHVRTHSLNIIWPFVHIESNKKKIKNYEIVKHDKILLNGSVVY